MKTIEQKRTTSANAQLTCPSCDKLIELSARDQIDGANVSCRHCGFESVLTREIEEHTDKSHWILEGPEADDLNSERR